MIKRFIDIILSICALIILYQVLFVTGLLVYLKLGRPIFFTQVRPGIHGNPFKMIKFRTMTDERDRHGELLPNQERMTKFGNFLRSASIDELPELINVFKGDMSLVGPRPLLMDYLPYFSDEQNRRHNVKPGITGWSQINGRNSINWDKKIDLDLWYVENQSLLLDFKILFLTVFKVLKRDGINYEKNVPMPRFDEYVKTKKEAAN